MLKRMALLAASAKGDPALPMVAILPAYAVWQNAPKAIAEFKPATPKAIGC